jgi:long-chain fatty acid transport protein
MKIRIVTTVSLLLTLFLMCGLAWGGGAYLTEISCAEVGLASAGWASRAQDAGTLFSNPAGMILLSHLC